MTVMRRVACLLVGVWLGAGVLMDVVVTQNFRSVDRTLEELVPEAAERVHALGHEQTRQFLRYHAGEQNRWLFEQWERVQLGIGLVLVLVLINAGTRAKWPLILTGGMLAIILADRFLMTPEVASLGRQLAFQLPTEDLDLRHKFGTLHALYSSLELVKLGMGGVLAWLVIRSQRHATKLTPELPVKQMHAK